MALSRDSDDEDMAAEPASRRSGKRLRVTRRDRAQASQGSTFTGDSTSMSGALEFDLTQLDSELEAPLPPEALLAPTRESESDNREREGRAKEKTCVAICPR